jgi:hypothetical protein
MSLDITGEDVEETGLVWDIGDADKPRPSPAALKRTWMGVPTAPAAQPLGARQGALCHRSRHVLAGAVRRLEAAGYAPWSPPSSGSMSSSGSGGRRPAAAAQGAGAGRHRPIDVYA